MSLLPKLIKSGFTFPRAAWALLPPRQILARMRDIMAGSGSANERLNRVVRLVASSFGAEVCSCYVLRAGEVLELFATVGLNPDAVHKTRLRVGEGLVGEIAARAAPIAVQDAPSHPSFAYRPETGEDPYSSFCGVPILRGRRVRGVLVIQHSQPHDYSDEILETLQTVAMVLAELLASGDLISRLEIAPMAGDASFMRPSHIEGVCLSRGLAHGQAVLHLPLLSIHEIVSDNPEAERHRFRSAVIRMHSAIDRILDTTAVVEQDEPRDILEAYRMFARDRGWISRIDEAIGQGLSAEAAVQRVQDENRARMLQMNDPYIRSRVQDLEDLSNRLLTHLAVDDAHQTNAENLPDNIILIARSLGPAALLEYDHARLRGVVLESGTENDHVAIIARALRIPVIGQCVDVLSYIEPGDPVIVDGDNATCYTRPSEEVIDMYNRSVDSRIQRQALFRQVRDKPAVTRDGQFVSLQLNAGLSMDTDCLEETGADGIGLFRTELSFLGKSRYPSVALQSDLYKRVMDMAGGRPVTFRTLDIGGDKPLPYFDSPREENPALGWRAIRIGLDRPAILRTQFRALIRAAHDRPLRIMLPLVADAHEIDLARQLLEMELSRAEKMRGTQGFGIPETVELGIMIEVPSLLWQLDLLVGSIDFLSVGSNDLMQYLFAADRGNSLLRNRYDTLSPPMLRTLAYIADVCGRSGIPLNVCGEMAGQPLEAMALVALGYRGLSMSPQCVGPVKAMLHSLDVGRLSPWLLKRMNSREQTLRPELLAFARDHGICTESLQSV